MCVLGCSGGDTIWHKLPALGSPLLSLTQPRTSPVPAATLPMSVGLLFPATACSILSVICSGSLEAQGFMHFWEAFYDAVKHQPLPEHLFWWWLGPIGLAVGLLLKK